MAILLHIDTAVETASVGLSDNDRLIGLLINENQKDHASWIHNAIKKLLNDASVNNNSLQAISISIGPGSYTGLRIGLSAAKGLCYALNVPLISIGTLEMMAETVNKEPGELFCPLIDARRMEVFTAVYDAAGQEIVKPCAMIVDKDSFSDLLSTHTIVFCGNGSKKLQSVLNHRNAIFSKTVSSAANLPHLAFKYFLEKKFASLAYTEPFYLKEFYSPF